MPEHIVHVPSSRNNTVGGFLAKKKKAQKDGSLFSLFSANTLFVFFIACFPHAEIRKS